MNLYRLMSCGLIFEMRSFALRVSKKEERSLRLHATIRSNRAVCALIALTPAQLLWTTSVRAQASVKQTIIAASGDVAPEGGNYRSFTTIAVNERGQVAFDALLTAPSTSGVFLSERKQVSAIALGGNPDPASGNFSFVSTPSITARGDVIFDTSTAIFSGDGRRTVPLVQNDDAAPGGGTLILSGGYVANPNGVIAYGAFVLGAVSTQGVFRTNGRRTIAIASDDTAPPTGGAFLLFGQPVISHNGQVAFFAEMSGGSADFGIYRSDGDNLTTIFAANQPAPGGGTFVDFGEPAINKHGDVLALGRLENGPGPTGLFLSDGRDVVTIALSGQGAPKGGNYTTGGAIQFFGPLSLNDRGQANFEAFLTGGTSRSGIFRGDGVTTTTIALEGTAAAGTTGIFESFGDMKMGKDGRVAFIATLKQGVGGVDLSNNIGIWVGTSDTDLHLVARSGENIAGKTLTRPLSLGPLEIKERPIVWLGRFSGNSTAIVSSDLDSECDD